DCRGEVGEEGELQSRASQPREPLRRLGPGLEREEGVEVLPASRRRGVELQQQRGEVERVGAQPLEVPVLTSQDPEPAVVEQSRPPDFLEPRSLTREQSLGALGERAEVEQPEAVARTAQLAAAA